MFHKIRPANGGNTVLNVLDFDEDISLIVSQYNKEYNDFDYDYRNISYKVFLLQISRLEGRYGDILDLRYRFLNGKKMSKEERQAALSVLTPKQKEEHNRKTYQAAQQTAASNLNFIANRLFKK